MIGGEPYTINTRCSLFSRMFPLMVFVTMGYLPPPVLAVPWIRFLGLPFESQEFSFPGLMVFKDFLGIGSR